MSLLVDLLSKAKTKEPKKDIPPDLRKTVVDGTFKKKTQRRVVILSTLVLIALLAGFAAIYVMETFKTSLAATIATKTRIHQVTPSLNIRDEKAPHHSKDEMLADIAVSAQKKALLSEAVSQRKPQTTGESSFKVADSVAKVNELSTPSDVRIQAKSAGKTFTGEAPSYEKTQQKTDKDVYLFAARTHETKNEFNQALEYYMKALELDPANHIVMNNIAGVFIRLTSYNDALFYAKKALDVKTNYVPSLINAGIAQVSLGNFSEGQGFLLRAAGIDPSNKPALFNLAVLFEKQKNYDGAYENYYKLSQMRDVDGCLGAARIMERQGQNSDAARFYQEILTIENTSPSIRQFANQRLSQLSR